MFKSAILWYHIQMKIIAIETSCDETGVSIIEFDKKDKATNETSKKEVKFKVLSDLLVSQIDLHKEYGGVFPNLAKREHEKMLPLLVEKSLSTLKKGIKEIDAICVTMGPGLAPALWVGVEFAKNLSKENSLPLYGINHMEGHIFASLVEKISENTFKLVSPKTPTLSLLISGGHTEIVYTTDFLKYKKIGETLDDAAGECFDKSARTIGISYPGGPEISKRASLARSRGDISSTDMILPRPMLHSKDLNFSFSGLKTAVSYAAKKFEHTEENLNMFCMEIENAITDVLKKKTEEAIYLHNAKSLIIGGGVSANNHIRKNMKDLCEENGVDLYIPDRNLSTDNSLMIAIIGMNKILNNIPVSDIETLKAEAGLTL